MNVIELESNPFEYVHGNDSVYDIIHIQSTETYDSFFKNVMFLNKPCLLEMSRIIGDWSSKIYWVKNNKPDYQYLGDKYGSTVVPVADCNEKYYNAQKKSEMKFCDFLKFWTEYRERDYPSSMPKLYLKDWHFIKDYPEENVYQVPKYFASDWLNEYLCNSPKCSDDYRFVYMGPKGSWTPFHVDVFTSFSWSVNVCGRKKWLLFPAGEEICLRDRHGQLAYDATAPELEDNVLFPDYKKIGKCYEVIQEAGDAIFIPSGWHHQVWNLEDTISINHNWVNGCNIHSMWKSLKDSLAAVKKEVEDCRDMDGWEEHCQLMLRATYGINYKEFYNFLHFIATRRLQVIEENKQISLFGGWTLGKCHAVFDLEQLRKVLDLLISDADAKSLVSFGEQNCEGLNLSKQIELIVLRIKNN